MGRGTVGWLVQVEETIRNRVLLEKFPTSFKVV